MRPKYFTRLNNRWQLGVDTNVYVRTNFITECLNNVQAVRPKRNGGPWFWF